MIPGSRYYGFLATLSRPGTVFKEYPLQIGTQLPFAKQPAWHDLFFSPNLFTVGVRQNEYAHGLQFLYADLDDAPYPDLAPTYHWFTSEGNTQAMWRIKGTLTLERWSTLNRALTRKTGADANGWGASKVLRVPGSINWKRGGEDGSTAEFQDVRYTPDSLYTYLSNEIAPPLTVQPHDGWPPLPDPQDKNKILGESWSYLGLLSRAMLTGGVPQDRSLLIVKMSQQLAREGAISPETAFELIWVQDWCKWRTDGWRPEMLWKEIQNAFGNHPA